LKGPSSSLRSAKTRPSTPVEPGPFALLLSQVKTDVDARLARTLDEERQLHQDTGPEVTAALDAASALCRGGKRLRAALVKVGQTCFLDETGATPRARRKSFEVAAEAGVALELLQAYFLIHDDWMDQDNTRRGVAAAHVVLAERFRSLHKGAAGAVLAGDYLVALATRHLVDAVEQHPAASDVMRCFANMQLDAVVGQQLDTGGLSRDAERVYQLKTGSYTVRGPLQLGAWLGGATRKQVAALQGFCEPLGIAFQIRDDLLGAFGSPEETGKPRGNDLLQGKWTWLVQYALAHGTAADKSALEAVFARPEATEKQIQQATHALESSGARAACEARIAELRQQSEASLGRLRISSNGRSLCNGAMHALLERRA
jgi:geranylgeranyl diphosphate synthase type I